MNRRTMLVASGMGLSALPWGASRLSAKEQESTETGQRAKSTILFFLCGGASHIDMWDMKPKAPLEYRGPFEPISTTASDVVLCEHLPMLAQQAHHLALLNSVDGRVNTNDHHAGYYHQLTGHVPDISFVSRGNNRTPEPDDWPFMGSVVASRRGKPGDLPGAVTLPHIPSRKPYTRPGQFAARLGVEHDPLGVLGTRDAPTTFRAPALELQLGLDRSRMLARRDLLDAVDATRRDFDTVSQSQVWTRQQERAFSLLVSSRTTKAFQLDDEPDAVRQRYGETVNGMSLLLARRLVEVGVPFITVFWLGHGVGSKTAKKCASAGSWDTHGNNFNCLKDDLLPEFDRCFSALIEDLADRGMIDETLLLVTSEMGRTPKIGDRRSGGASGAGRDHWTHCLTDVMAGGGIQGGQRYGSSDRFAEYPADRPITPADVAKTVYHSMGIHDLEAISAEGRPYNLLPHGRPLVELF